MPASGKCQLRHAAAAGAGARPGSLGSGGGPDGAPLRNRGAAAVRSRAGLRALARSATACPVPSGSAPSGAASGRMALRRRGLRQARSGFGEIAPRPVRPRRARRPAGARPGARPGLLRGLFARLDVELAAVDLAAVEGGDRLGGGLARWRCRQIRSAAAPRSRGRAPPSALSTMPNGSNALGQPLIRKIRRQIADENIALVVAHPHAIRLSRHPRWFFRTLRRRPAPRQLAGPI